MEGVLKMEKSSNRFMPSLRNALKNKVAKFEPERFPFSTGVTTITSIFYLTTTIYTLMKVSQAMSCTPSCVSCMNSKSLLTTVFRNFQCARRNRGYCPTTYMMFDAIIAWIRYARKRILFLNAPNKIWDVRGQNLRTLSTRTFRLFSIGWWVTTGDI